MIREEFNIWIALLLFGIYFIYDIFYTWFIISVQKLKPTLSASISSAMYLISAVGVLKYTENPYYLAPIAMGAWAGTYLFIRREKKKATKDKNKL